MHESKGAANAPIADQLARFDQHKKEILEKLEIGYGRGPRSEPFNPEKSWHDLLRFADFYFWGQILNQSMPSTERFNRLRQLGWALDRAHKLTYRAMHEDISNDLFRAWFAVNFPDLKPIDATDHISCVTVEIKKLVDNLKTLGDVAFTAAAKVRPQKSGRPPLLSSEAIQVLAHIYKKNTESKPGRGSGPFAKFVAEVIRAINPSGFNVSDKSVIDTIQNAHRQYKPSSFDE